MSPQKPPAQIDDVSLDQGGEGALLASDATARPPLPNREAARQNVLRGLQLMETAARIVRQNLTLLWGYESDDPPSAGQPQL